MVKILDNCCSLKYLDYLKHIAATIENWNLRYPEGKGISIEEKFLKLDIIANCRIRNTFLAGLAIGLLIQIHEAGGQDLFIPDIVFCGISIKDKHKLDKIHTDEEPDSGLVKILGIINSDWKEEWGGGFHHNGTSNYIKPTSFCIFDPTEPHAAEEIFTDKKRLAIDLTVFKDQQSLDEKMKRLRG